MIVIGYATIAKAFAPASIVLNGTSTITFTLTNPNGIGLTGAGFTDNFPVAPGPMTTTAAAQNYIGAGRGTCTGAIPSAGTGPAASVTFTGIAIPANSSCTVLVDVTSGTAGNYTKLAPGVTAAETGATVGPASNPATLAVGRPPPP